LSLVGW